MAGRERLPRGAVLKALGNGEGSIAIPRTADFALILTLFSLPAFGFAPYALRDGGAHAWVALPFFAAGTIVLWIAYRDWKASDIPVVLSPEGLFDRRHAAGPIAWSRISQCRMTSARLATAGVMFQVAPDNSMPAPAAISLDCRSVGCFSVELLQAIELMCRRWG